MNFDFPGLRSSVESLQKRLRELREKAEALRLQIAAINAAPAARSDLDTALDRWVDAMATDTDRQFAAAIGGLANSPSSLKNARYVDAALQLIRRDTDEPLERQLTRVLCALFPAQIKASLRSAAASLRLQGGLAMADRAAAVERVSAEITQLNDEEARLRRDAIDAGIKL